MPQKPPAESIVRLRLFVAGNSLRSQQAIKTLRRICDDDLGGNADLEVIDIYQQPERAEEHQVMAAPTLLKLLPLPMLRITGDLSEPAYVLHSLNLGRAGQAK